MKMRSGKALYRRYCLWGTVFVFAVIFFILLLPRLGKYSIDDDPQFIPHEEFVKVHDN